MSTDNMFTRVSFAARNMCVYTISTRLELFLRARTKLMKYRLLILQLRSDLRQYDLLDVFTTETIIVIYTIGIYKIVLLLHIFVLFSLFLFLTNITLI